MNAMDIKTAYNQLTNVDIEQQKQIWDERGKGYYGEYLVFCELYKIIPGNGKILMNLNVPVSASKSTEIDLVLIHETGIYVFEIKHYKGTIYGKSTDPIWTQYFRTAKNNTFKNPIEQNRYHIEALSKLFPDIPISSCIVFTSSDCDIRVTNSNENVDVCRLGRVSQILSDRFSKSSNEFSMEEIDAIFIKMSSYSQMKEKIMIDSEEADFLSWVQPTILGLEKKKDEVEQARQSMITHINELKKTKIVGICVNIAVAIFSILISAGVAWVVVKSNNEKLNTFQQKFLHVDEIDNEYIDDLQSYVEVSDVSLTPLTDDAVSFKAKLAMKNDKYCAVLTENTKYIVMTNSGQVFEYDMFGEHLHYYRVHNSIGKIGYTTGELKEILFYGISDINDISYVKITDVQLTKNDISNKVIKSKLEIVLYSK